MGVRIFINNGTSEKGALAQVTSRLPRTAIGRSSREQEILDLMDAAAVIPFLTASGAVVGRGAIGPGFDIVEARLGERASQRKRKRIIDFFNYISPMQRNIKDVFGPLAKIYTTAFSFRMFGHAAWEIVTDKSTGAPVGFDVIPGVIKPNINPDGSFKSPAYIQFLRSGGVDSKTEFASPDNVIFFGVPDYAGGIYMADMLSLTEHTLPSEIYAAVAYRSLHENRDAPYSGFWYTPQDIDDDTFKRFVAMIQARYTGSQNYGRNPIVMKGEGGFKSVAPSHDDAPYLEGRSINRDEMSAASGVPSAKYGVDSSGENLKELRREFYESTLRPFMALIEEVVYQRVCVGIFNAPEWAFRFKRPDFTTATEDASIELRRIQWGQWSPNEARASRGEAPREGGDYYLIPANMNPTGDGKPGRPEDEEVDDNEGDNPPSEEDTVPGTEPPVPTGGATENLFDGMIDELRKWRRFSIRVAGKKRYKREFVPILIHDDLYEFISDCIEDAGSDTVLIASIFDDAIELMEERNGA